MLKIFLGFLLSFIFGMGLGFKGSRFVFLAIKTRQPKPACLTLASAYAQDNSAQTFFSSSGQSENVQAQPAPVAAKPLSGVYRPLPDDGSEVIFSDMDRLNLKMARIQMEIKMAQLQLQKLSLQVEQAKLYKELEQIGPVGPQEKITSRIDIDAPLALLSIISFGAQRSASFKVKDNIYELREGEALEAFDGVTRRISEIDPATDSVVILENGKSKRYYIAGKYE